MDSHCVNLKEPDLPFLSLKPRLLKCTTLAMKNMSTSEKNDVRTKVLHLSLPQLRRTNHGEDITS